MIIYGCQCFNLQVPTAARIRRGEIGAGRGQPEPPNVSFQPPAQRLDLGREKGEQTEVSLLPTDLIVLTV